MTANHIHFELWCALAASGQLTQTELAELREHAITCGACGRRIAELTELGAHLLLAHAMTHPGRRPPMGMKDRFVARAICEGVPLNTRSSTINARMLGCAAAIILCVLSIAVVHKRGFSPEGSEGIHSHPPLAIHAENTSHAEPGSSKLPRSAVQQRDNYLLRDKAALTGQRYGRRSAETTEPSLASAARLSHRFVLNGYAQQNSLIRDYSATRVLPDAFRSSSPWFQAPVVALRINSEINKGESPGLLADCEYCSFSSSSVRPRFAFAPSANKVLYGTLDLGMYPSDSKAHFNLDPTAFHLIQGVVP
jgi:hypothetical protein